MFARCGLLTLWLYGNIFSACVLGTSLPTVQQRTTTTMETRANVNAKATSFLSSLGLTPDQTAALIDKLISNYQLEQFLNGLGLAPSVLTAAVCATAQASLGSDAVDTTPLNQTVVDENWSQTCVQTPQCIIQPKSTADVSKSIKIIKFFGAKYALRSGGHSPNPGWSSVSATGVLIDLQRLNQITVSGDKKIASLGPGQRWGQVIAALDPYGVTVIGGRIPPVGVGGLILGGGFFHFSPEYGLSADNVKNFEIVLSDGTITSASASQNADLFWALKGGGPNFGIVTRYDLYTVPIKNIWYQVEVHSVDNVPAILDAFASWQNNGGSTDVKGTVALIIGLESVTLGLIYSAPADKPASFAPFYNLPAPLAVAVPPTNGTVLSLTNILGSTASSVPARHDYYGASSKIDAQLYKDVYSYWKSLATPVHASTGANMTFVLQPITKQLVQAGKAKGGNVLGLPEINHQWWTTLVDWTNPADDAVVRSVAIKTHDKWVELGQARGLYVPFQYMNDAGRELNPLASYGADNLAKLKTISKKYDAAQVFQNLQNDGFLLRKT